MGNPSFCQRAKRFLLGAPRDLFAPKLFHRISLIAFFAWVGLGADGISSSCYGPEEAFLALGHHTVLALFVAVATVFTVFIISGRYAQIMTLIWLNLRGVKESVTILAPIFMAFMLSHIPLVLYAVGHHAAELPEVASAVSTDLSGAVREMGWLGGGAILVRAYTMGAGTYTGIEAISNSLPTF